MQTITFDSVSLDELDTNFTQVLKTLFQGRNLRITVEAEMDETEYLNSSVRNREILVERMANVEAK
ncbi:MAG: hypothetical protein EAZ70_00895 [Runella slithyformis]|nr:MAG: hypothetical protein EAY79_08465 [Runella slithyformis]TAF29679.1 MAG: hypothetical protein EAZ70_00895 [Runella slithyformis]TAF48498.1 MAG: hypothetical protein EAZ63_04280 [Runella slithyformis]TAF83296.1 MAG: hypothetical protein EAZ50_01335 [Runella slithyformis]TAG73631.1 MAG: hypothetical protein EAZ26_03050 [Runella slithyformis]